VAFSFSSTARKKIEEAKGRIVRLKDLPEINEDISAIKILK
jgi:ribosomal protein L18E